MVANAIPLSEIMACCDLFGITDIDDRVEFVTIIQAMDSAFLDFYSRKTVKVTGRR